MTVVIVDTDDWQGVYVNGHLAYANHTISARTLLEVLDIPHEFVRLQVLPHGRLPKSLDDVPRPDWMKATEE